MARGLALVISATLLLTLGCDGGSSRTTAPPPPGNLDLSGTWSGEAVVVDTAGWSTGCPWMSYAYPAGSSWAAQAAFTQQDARVEVRFSHTDLLQGLFFSGTLADGHLNATLDAGATQHAFPCSPMSMFVAGREVGGTLEAVGAGDDLLVATATLVYRRMYMGTNELFGEEFAAPLRLTLHRASGG